MSILRHAIGVTLVASTLGGCATITRGTSQDYAIDSRPTGASVSLSTGQTCETPCKLHLKRRDEFVARVNKEGYDPVDIEVESRVMGGGGAAGAGNLLFGGIVGGVVDATNGSMNNLLPEPLLVKLARSGSGEQSALMGKDGKVVDTVDNHNATVVRRRGDGKTKRASAAASEPVAPSTTPTDD